jgi:hypothetical protein
LYPFSIPFLIHITPPDICLVKKEAYLSAKVKTLVLMDRYRLSQRGAANVEAVWPRISQAASERENVLEHPYLDLPTSENWLLRQELIELYQNAVVDSLRGQACSSALL